jgi:hypothetical protein
MHDQSYQRRNLIRQESVDNFDYLRSASVGAGGRRPMKKLRMTAVVWIILVPRMQERFRGHARSIWCGEVAVFEGEYPSCISITGFNRRKVNVSLPDRTRPLGSNSPCFLGRERADGAWSMRCLSKKRVAKGKKRDAIDSVFLLRDRYGHYMMRPKRWNLGYARNEWSHVDYSRIFTWSLVRYNRNQV